MQNTSLTSVKSVITPMHRSSAHKNIAFQDTPYFVTDLSVVRSQVKLFKELLPDVGLYYAVKANNSPALIAEIDSFVDGYDIASLGEAENLLRENNVDASRLLYSNPVKIPRHIKDTYDVGVRRYAFDSITEIEKLRTYAPGSDVYLRIRVSDYGSKFPLSKKFGVDPLHAVDYCSIAKDAGLNVKGLTFHVGSQSENLQVWETAIEISSKVIKKLKKLDFDIEFLDLGGGFPANYGEPAPSIAEVADVINKSVAKHLPADIKLVAEPGRFVAANSTTLVTTVIGREHRGGTDWLYLDVGAFQGLMEPLEMPNMKYPIQTDKDPKGYMKSFVLTGPSCDACDTIGLDYMLPSEISVGDKLYIGATGAYTRVYASNFNGFEIPEVRYINSTKGE